MSFVKWTHTCINSKEIKIQDISIIAKYFLLSLYNQSLTLGYGQSLSNFQSL